MKVLLDATAILAYLQAEPGWQTVEAAILATNAAVCPINLAETASKLVERGMSVETAGEVLTTLQLELLTYGWPEIAETARLRPLTRQLGLSLGDRACLATAKVHTLTVLTADHAWLTLADDLGMTIQSIRA